MSDCIPAASARDPSIRAVAYFEAFKGVLALLAASGLLLLASQGVHDLVVRLAQHGHLNPASRDPHVLLSLIADVPRPDLLLMAAGALGYATIRFFESYGLFRERAWAEWLAAVSGGIYVPFELLALWRHPNWLSLAILLVNLLVVAVVVRALILRRRQAKAADLPVSDPAG